MNCRTWFTVLGEYFLLSSEFFKFAPFYQNYLDMLFLFFLIVNNNKRSIILEIKTTGVKLLKY